MPMLNAAVRKTPPTKASSNRIEGKAMRRLAVKNSASPQAVAATASGASGLGPSPSNANPRPWPIE